MRTLYTSRRIAQNIKYTGTYACPMDLDSKDVGTPHNKYYEYSKVIITRIRFVSIFDGQYTYMNIHVASRSFCV